jgi:hypothetical protein
MSDDDILPVNRLPPELLCKIFECVHDETIDISTLSYVCRRWRETAISYSRLWSYISLPPVAPVLYKQWCIQRSAPDPLDANLILITTMKTSFLVRRHDDSDAAKFFLKHIWNLPACLDLLSTAQFSKLADLRISCGKIPLHSDTLRRFFTNIPSLRILRVMNFASSPFLQPLLDTSMCPRLETIQVAITTDGLEEVFKLVKGIVVPRAMAFVRNIRVEHTIEINDDEEDDLEDFFINYVSGEWIQLCDENQITHSGGYVWNLESRLRRVGECELYILLQNFKSRSRHVFSVQELSEHILRCVKYLAPMTENVFVCC